MSTTKRSFMLSGSIISIVLSVILIAFGSILIILAPHLTTDNFVKIYESDTVNYEKHLDDAGEIDYFIEKGTDPAVKVYVKDLDSLSKVLNTSLKVLGGIIVGVQVATLVFSILVIGASVKGKSKIGLIITLLILSIFSCNVLTFAFMIVCLCLKDKPEVEIETKQA